MQIYQKIFLWVQHLTYVLARFYPKKSAAQYKLAACKDFSLQAAVTHNYLTTNYPIIFLGSRALSSSSFVRIPLSRTMS